MKRFKDFIKEASDFHYFTGKNVVKDFLNQAPVQKTRSYDSDDYKDSTIRFLTDEEDNVRKETEEDEIDVNLADDILFLKDFESFNKASESVKNFSYIKSRKEFLISEGIFHAHYRPDNKLIDDIEKVYPLEMDEIIFSMISRNVDDSLQRINDFINGEGVETMKFNSEIVKYVKLNSNKPTILHYKENYHCKPIEELMDRQNENLIGYSKGHNPTNSTEFYHVTHKDHIDKILKQGIRPMDIKTYKELSYPNAVYFSESLIGAKQNLIDIAQYLKVDVQDMVAIKFKLPKNAHIIEDRWMGNDSLYTPDEFKPAQIMDVYKGQDFLKLREDMNESNQYQDLMDLSLEDIIKIRGLWSSFLPFHSFDDVEKAKVIKTNQKIFEKFKKDNPEMDMEFVNMVLDWFTYGLDEDNEEELPKEEAPSAQELYDYFQSEEFSNMTKSRTVIGKYKL